ncbi:MAG: sigma-E factor regulatory protein RseB domain-containing protein [Armatimonadota bacterium]|nr:sigma-E factor regulatory protein RseB domain-containing protein [Armatimonadota bacterium]
MRNSRFATSWGLVAGAAWAALVGLLPAAAATDLQKVAGRVFQRPRSVAHAGTMKVTLAAAPAPATVRVYCDGKGNERREYVDGPASGTVVLTVGDRAWTRGASDRQWKVLPPSALDAGAWQRLQRNYRFEPRETRRVAGRKAVGLAVLPKQAGNPSQVIWVDEASGLVLRAEQYGSSGALTMTSVYESVSLGVPRGVDFSAPAEAEVAPVAPPDQWEKVASLDELERRVGHRVPRPTAMPPGYVLSSVYLRGCVQGDKHPVLRYDDGLNPLTLFVSHGPAGGGGRGRGGRGWGWGRLFGGKRGTCWIEDADGQAVARTVVGNHVYVLVGDLPAPVLQSALRSIE